MQNNYLFPLIGIILLAGVVFVAIKYDKNLFSSFFKKSDSSVLKDSGSESPNKAKANK